MTPSYVKRLSYQNWSLILI